MIISGYLFQRNRSSNLLVNLGYKFIADYQSEMSGLIKGLPYEIALRCLAFVPLNDHPNLELVSHSWRDAIRSDYLFKVRKEVGSSENLLCVCAFHPVKIWQVYSPTCDRWLTLPLLPSNIHNLFNFRAVTIGEKLFVLGGSSGLYPSGDHGDPFATNEVWSYDFVERRWTQLASMLVPRAMFACCVLKGNIVVAGGFTNFGEPISAAEIYNPETNLWTALPDLHQTHNSACSGLVLKDKVHVLHQGLSTVQVLESRWAVKDYRWPEGPMTVIKDVPYVVNKRQVFKQEGETWKMVGSALEFNRGNRMAITSLCEEVVVLGGMIGPIVLNWDVKKLSDVNFLTVGNGNDSQMWRKVARMTRCRGVIIGCTQLTI